MPTVGMREGLGTPKSKNATNKKLCCRDLPVIQDQNGILSLDPIEIVAGESH